MIILCPSTLPLRGNSQKRTHRHSCDAGWRLDGRTLEPDQLYSEACPPPPVSEYQLTILSLGPDNRFPRRSGGQAVTRMMGATTFSSRLVDTYKTQKYLLDHWLGSLTSNIHSQQTNESASLSRC